MTTDSHPPEPCAKCRDLEAQVFRLAMERQHLLEQVARERMRANALYLAFPPQTYDEGSAPPPPPAASQVPLRYQVADAINEVVKRVLPGAHRAIRSSVEKGK